MATRNVVLTDQQDELISSLIKNGRYQNASEALRAGLRLLEQEETGLHALRDRLSTSLGQAERGEFVDGTPEEIFARAFDKAVARHGAE